MRIGITNSPPEPVEYNEMVALMGNGGWVKLVFTYRDPETEEYRFVNGDVDERVVQVRGMDLAIDLAHAGVSMIETLRGAENAHRFKDERAARATSDEPVVEADVRIVDFDGR